LVQDQSFPKKKYKVEFRQVQNFMGPEELRETTTSGKSLQEKRCAFPAKGRIGKKKTLSKKPLGFAGAKKGRDELEGNEDGDILARGGNGGSKRARRGLFEAGESGQTLIKKERSTTEPVRMSKTSEGSLTKTGSIAKGKGMRNHTTRNDRSGNISQG